MLQAPAGRLETLTLSPPGEMWALDRNLQGGGVGVGGPRVGVGGFSPPPPRRFRVVKQNSGGAPCVLTPV